METIKSNLLIKIFILPKPIGPEHFFKTLHECNSYQANQFMKSIYSERAGYSLRSSTLLKCGYLQPSELRYYDVWKEQNDAFVNSQLKVEQQNWQGHQRMLKDHSLVNNETLFNTSEVPKEIFSVLVAEDNTINQMVLQHFFNTRFQVTCDIANDGRQALSLCQTKVYSIILMDLRMPHIGGLEVPFFTLLFFSFCFFIS